MGSYLSEPITETASVNECNDKLNTGSSSMQGWRVSQEDAHNCILDFDENSALFAVYDGHGGHEVAVYCSKKLPDFIKSTEAYKNGDMKTALIDAFLGFDATIATPEVVTLLQEIAGVKQNDDEGGGKDNPSEASDLEDSVTDLREEAAMPLDQVIKKYTSQKGIGQSVGDKVTSSPYLRARKNEEGASSSTGEGSSSGGSSLTIEEVEIAGGSGVSSSSSSKSQKTQEDINGGECDSSDAVKNEDAEKVSESHLQNGDATHNEAESATAEVSKENGDVKKGKALKKTKGVEPEVVVSKEVLKRKAKSLINKLLEVDSESESDEDENDKTFVGPNDDISSDESGAVEEESGNDEEESAEDEEEDLEDEEEEEEDSDEFDADNYAFAKNMREEPGSDSGCTAVVALLRGNELYVANAGDSRCVVCRDGKAIEMSFDHKPEDDIERDRVVKAGGKVTSDGRVNGGLNLSRAIGDHAYKQNKDLSDREQMITALPDVKVLTLNPKEDEFMVLACDGIWNVMSSQDVVDFVKSRFSDCREKPAKICEELFGNCLAPNTAGDGTGCDNMTAIIVQFKNSLCKRSVSETGDDLETSNNKRMKSDNDKPTPSQSTTVESSV